jgi:hypothetical protein
MADKLIELLIERLHYAAEQAGKYLRIFGSQGPTLAVTKEDDGD